MYYSYFGNVKIHGLKQTDKTFVTLSMIYNQTKIFINFVTFSSLSFYKHLSLMTHSLILIYVFSIYPLQWLSFMSVNQIF